MEIALKSFWPAIDHSWRSARTTCDNPACHNTQLMRTIPGGRSGIQAGDRWYCSVDCLAVGSRPVLAELSRIRYPEIGIPRVSIGLVLVDKGYLSPDAHRYARSQSELRHESLESTLMRLGLVNEKQLAAARASQWGYPLLAKERIGHALETDIPAGLLEVFSALPIDISLKARRILLGFVFRVEHSLLESIEKITGCQTIPCFISSSEYAEHKMHVAAARDCQHTLVQDPGTPEEMSRTIGRFAVEIGARKAEFTHCRNFVWVRLTGKRDKFDVLFQFEESAHLDLLQKLQFEERIPYLTA